MQFDERTITVVIDEELCWACATKACIDACRKYDRGLLVLANGLPHVDLSPEEIKRRGTECLACEHACHTRGNRALRIDIPIPGLDEYRAGNDNPGLR